MQSTTDTKKGFITCSKLVNNELARFPTRPENVCFANNEQPLIAVLFCFTHAEHSLYIVTRNNSLETCVQLLFMLLQDFFASARFHRVHKSFCYRKV